MMKQYVKQRARMLQHLLCVYSYLSHGLELNVLINEKYVNSALSKSVVCSRCSSVSIVTWPWSGQPKNCGSIKSKVKTIFSSSKDPDRF